MIFNSIKYSRISNLLDGSEDGQIRGNENIEKGNKIIQIKNDDYVASTYSDE